MNVVIYTQRVEIFESYGERRDCADQRIADFIYECGFLPLPLPNRDDIVEEVIKSIHPKGIVLTGGNSLSVYGGNAPERDAMDIKLIDIAIKHNIPLMGFCRGMQSILYYFGNILENVDGHVAVRHEVYFRDGMYEVNSYHSQACKKLNEDSNLTVMARTVDNVIEAVCHKEFPIIGIMWHPEREDKYKQKDMEMLRKLFYEKKVWEYGEK